MNESPETSIGWCSPPPSPRPPRVRGERDLKGERRPQDERVSRELDRVALAAPIGPAAEDLPTQSVALGMPEKKLVDPTQVVERVDFSFVPVVKPPEIDALLLERRVHG